MKVYQSGKEVKNATVSYFEGGQPAHVTIDGVNYDPSAFKFKDEADQKKTKDTKQTAKKTTQVGQKPAKSSGAMTTKDV